MKTLIAYYSFTQNNEKLANYLRKKLNCDIVKIETTNKRNGFSIMFDLLFNRKPDIKPSPYYLDDYQHVIFVAPIWAGRIAMPMKSYLINEAFHIKQYSFITLCGGSTGQKEKIKNELVSILGKPPIKLLELWVNELLPAEKRDTIKYTSGFRIQSDGFEKFENQLRDFIKEENMIHSI